MSDENEKNDVESRRPPVWLRAVLMVILILFVAYAFYLTNQGIIERLNAQ